MLDGERGSPAVKDHILTGLDLGSTAVRAVVASSIGEPLGLGLSPPSIMERQPDRDQLAASIAAAVREADAMAAYRSRRLWIALSGDCLRRETIVEATDISAPDHGVSWADLEGLRAALAARLPDSLHCWPVSARIDGRQLWENPLGKKGRQLEVTFFRCELKPEKLNLIWESLTAAGYEFAGCLAGELAATAALTPAEREIGAAVIDLGAAHTTVAVCLRGMVRATAAIRIGGESATKDLAIALGLSQSKAEELKLALMKAAPLKELDDTMPSRVLSARCREIFELIRAELDRMGWADGLPGGYVLTGGGAMTEYPLGLAREILRGPVRLGHPEIAGMDGMIIRPDSAVLLGLVPAIKAYGKTGTLPKGDIWWR